MYGGFVYFCATKRGAKCVSTSVLINTINVLVRSKPVGALSCQKTAVQSFLY